MNPQNMLRLSRITRPYLRRRTPLISRLLKGLLSVICPPDKPGRGKRLVAEFDGGLIHIDTSSSMEYHLLFRGCHEPEIVNLIQHRLRPGDVCLDVGANVGSHTMVMARAVGPAGRVISMEPHPAICRRLLENVSLNRMEQVTVVQAAFSDRDGTADFFGFSEDAFHQGISSLLPDVEANRKMTVRTICGPTLLREQGITRCDLIKIDAEGVESVVLTQLAGLIQAFRPAIICEYRKAHWEKFGHSLEAEVERLRGLNYTLYIIRRDVTRPLELPVPDSCELFAVPAVEPVGGTR